jgi:uncharacterized membrane protein (Fun14 family)
MIDALTSLLAPLAQLSIGGFGGFLTGYAIKKIIKMAVFFLGLGSLCLLYLSHGGIISINYDNLADAVSAALPQMISFFSTVFAILPLASSFAAGFGLGMLKG